MSTYVMSDIHGNYGRKYFTNRRRYDRKASQLAGHHIAIDCGCSFPGGRLGCLRLEDMKEFYVENDGE